MWRHRCAGGLKKKYLRSGSQRHRHFAGFFNLPVLHRHGPPFLYCDSDIPPNLVAFYDTLGIWRMYSRLKPPASSRGIIVLGTFTFWPTKNYLWNSHILDKHPWLGIEAGTQIPFSCSSPNPLFTLTLHKSSWPWPSVVLLGRRQ